MVREISVGFASVLCACSAAQPGESRRADEAELGVFIRTAEVGTMQAGVSSADPDPGFETVVREVFQGGPIERSESKRIHPGDTVRFVRAAEPGVSVEISLAGSGPREFISYEVTARFDGRTISATDGVAQRGIGDCAPGSGSRTIIFAPEDRADANAPGGLAVEVTFCGRDDWFGLSTYRRNP